MATETSAEPLQNEKITTTLTVHAFDWQVRDTIGDNSKVTILSWCLNQKSEPCLLRFHDFPAYCYLELPLFIGHRRMNWTKVNTEQVYEAICWKLGDDRPFKFFFKQVEKLYYYRGGKKYPMLVLLFNNIRSMFTCKNRLNQPFQVKDLGIVACKIWETNISLVRKLLTLRNTKHCQWFNIEGIKVQEEDKISTLANEYVVDRMTMFPIDPEKTGSWVTKPTILSFDIETYSDRHKALPDPYSSKHVAYLLSIVFQRRGEPETRIKEIILLGDCDDTDMATVFKVKTEIELIDLMSDRVNKYNPDIIIGYNIFGYDNPYLDTRLKRRLREWKPMGRLIGEPTTMTSFSWGSSGYGKNDINYLNTDGRIMIDLLPIIRRDYKLNLYNLGFVSTYFLGRTKHPITAKEMFETYELSKDSEVNPNILLTDYVKSKMHLLKSDPDVTGIEYLFNKLHVLQFMPPDANNNRTANFINIPLISLKEHAMSEMRKVVEYCVVDSVLVLDLFELVHCWISLIETANVDGVTPVELFTRGQQVRVLSSVYDEASRDGIVIDERIVPRMEYSGGLVQKPGPGLYDLIPNLDFKSLYPTIMISHNIDYRTFVPPEMMDKIPDSMCHVIEWEEEVSNKKKETEKDDSDSDDDTENGAQRQVVKYRFKFIKQEHMIGILPRLLIRLIAERDKVRALQKKYPKDSIEWIVLERRQLAIKISSNSKYGALGAQVGGKLPLPEAAASVTAQSRKSIRRVNDYMGEKGYTVVYGDTDSCMPDIGLTDPTKAYAAAHALAKELSALFPAPMQVEDEEVYYKMLCIKPKMYICITMSPNGIPNMERNQLKMKGVAPARRDNCLYQRDCFIDTAWNVMKRKPIIECFNDIIEMCLKLMRREVQWKDLVVIKGLGSHYKSASYCMKVFSDELCKIGKPAVPGDRLEYLIVKSHGIKDKQLLGYKMRLPSTYLERLDSENPEHIDYEYYMEKALMNCIQKQLFQIGYKKELEELNKKYLDIDQTRVFEGMRKSGYGVVIDQVMTKFNGNKSQCIEYLLNTDLKKVINPLITYYIKKRGQINTRMNGEPIKMMVKFI